ncbi:hypothetical protein D3C76_1475670 [compost metagenome]
MGVGHRDVTRQTQGGYSVSLHDGHDAVAFFHHLGVLDRTTSVDDVQRGAGLASNLATDSLAEGFIRTSSAAGAEGQFGWGGEYSGGSDGEQCADQETFHAFTPVSF